MRTVAEDNEVTELLRTYDRTKARLAELEVDVAARDRANGDASACSSCETLRSALRRCEISAFSKERVQEIARAALAEGSGGTE